MSNRWAGSNRRAELPANWRTIRARIWERDGGRCQMPAPGGGVCGWRGRDVDHIQAGNDHSDGNLRVLCGWHHDRKSSSEGNAARRRPTSTRRPEQHPGLM